MKDTIHVCCPICSSWDWHQISNDYNGSSYSIGKGLIGSALLGPIGAVAGIGGKTKRLVTYKCDKCGHTRSYRQ